MNINKTLISVMKVYDFRVKKWLIFVIEYSYIFLSIKTKI